MINDTIKSIYKVNPAQATELLTQLESANPALADIVDDTERQSKIKELVDAQITSIKSELGAELATSIEESVKTAFAPAFASFRDMVFSAIPKVDDKSIFDQLKRFKLTIYKSTEKQKVMRDVEVETDNVKSIKNMEIEIDVPCLKYDIEVIHNLNPSELKVVDKSKKSENGNGNKDVPRGFANWSDLLTDLMPNYTKTLSGSYSAHSKIDMLIKKKYVSDTYELTELGKIFDGASK